MRYRKKVRTYSCITIGCFTQTLNNVVLFRFDSVLAAATTRTCGLLLVRRLCVPRSDAITTTRSEHGGIPPSFVLYWLWHDVTPERAP